MNGERPGPQEGVAGAAGGPGPRRSQPAAASAVADCGHPLLLLLFLFLLLVPGTFSAGPLQLSLYKIFLLLATIPLGILWIRGAAGRIVPADILILAFAGWQVLSLFIHHGLTRVPYMGTNFVETFGAYLVGRVLVTSAARFVAFFRYLLLCFMLLLPFALVELLTGQRLWREIFGSVLTMPDNVRGEKRMGLTRVYLGLPHPIHVGFVASLAIANVHYIFAGRWLRRLGLTGIAGAMTFVGLSSAPMLGALLQGVMIAWDRIVRVLRGHWVLFGLSGAVSLAVLQMALPGGIIGYLVNEVIFNPYGGANRIDIFNYGIAEVVRNPVFGIGLNEWRRPFWQHATLDNFWLLITMRYGIPGFLLLAGTIAVSGLSIASAKGLTPEEANYRTGYLIALASGIVVLGTVHIWESPVAFFMAYIGAGAWFYNRAGTAAAVAGPDARNPGARRFTRAPVTRGHPAAGQPAAMAVAPTPAPLPAATGAEAAEARRRASREATLQRRAAGSAAGRPER